MIKAINSTTDLPALKQVLCVYQPTLIHPGWEKLVAGKPIGEMDIPDIRALPKIRQALLWKSYRQYFRVNPRDPDYMLVQARDFVNRFEIRRADLLIPAALTALIAEEFRQPFRRIWSVEYSRSLNLKPIWDDLKSAGYDAIVFLYPDPLGLGWGRTERALTGLGVLVTIVLNGRRRLFLWDPSARSALRLRRFLDNIWFDRIAFSLLVVMIGFPLAFVDTVWKAFKVEQ